MLQVKMKGPFTIVCEDGSLPLLKDNEAVIDVKANGICGSDMHRYTGREPIKDPDRIIGHEYGGVITEIKGNAEKLKVGMKVSVNPCISCGSCFYCMNSLGYLCENQRVVNGMTERAVVPIKNIVRLDQSFDMILSPMVEPTAAAIHATKEIKNSRVLIIGTGSIGLIEQQLLKINGNEVITTDIEKYGQNISKKFGADLVMDFNNESKTEEIREYLEYKKIDIVFDNVCSEETLDFAIKAIKKNGTIIVVGVCNKKIEVDFRAILLYEIKIQASLLYSHSDFIKASEYISRGLLDLYPLISKVYELKKAKEAFEFKNSKPSLKIILKT